MNQTTRALLLGSLFVVTAPALQAGEAAAPPVTIKVIQVTDAAPACLRVQVSNSSAGVVIVDREALQQPDFMVSKEGDTEQDGTRTTSNTGMAHGVVGGRWSLEQLKRREPKRVVTIPPGETFKMDVPAKTVLGRIDEQFLAGTIEARFSFHGFLLSVGGQEPAEALFDAFVRVEPTTIEWQQSEERKFHENLQPIGPR